MTKHNLEKGNNIEKSLKCISDLYRIVSYPYPHMFSKNKKDQKRGFTYDGDIVSFYGLDNETREQLKAAINEVLEKRRTELCEEMDSL